MKYKVKLVRKWKAMPDEYALYYKKWHWIFWVHSGYEGTNKNGLLKMAHDLTVGKDL